MLQITNIIPDNQSVFNNGKRQRYVCGFKAQSGDIMTIYMDSYRGVPSLDEIELFVLSCADYCLDFDSYLHNLEVICDADTTDDDIYNGIDYEWATAQEFEVLVGKQLLEKLREKHNW